LADLSRLHDFTAGQPIRSQEVDDELNQLVATLNALDLENLSAALQNTFLRLATQADRKISFGQVTIGFSAVNDEEQVQVAHGLGTTPSRFLLSQTDSNGDAVYAIAACVAKGPTECTIKAIVVSSFVAFNVNVTWDFIAIG
jgi:hypothetical protein